MPHPRYYWWKLTRPFKKEVPVTRWHFTGAGMKQYAEAGYKYMYQAIENDRETAERKLHEIMKLDKDFECEEIFANTYETTRLIWFWQKTPKQEKPQ